VYFVPALTRFSIGKLVDGCNRVAREIDAVNAMGKANPYYENTEGGLGGAASNRQQAKVQALVFTYLINELK